jgi:hypothetical protein
MGGGQYLPHCFQGVLQGSLKVEKGGRERAGEGRRSGSYQEEGSKIRNQR